MSEGLEGGAAGARFGLHARTLAAVQETLASAPGLRRAWVFGSRATGRYRPASDLDLALDAPAWGGPEFAALCHKLDTLGLMVKIDALHWQSVADPVLRAEIERDRRPLWSAPVLRSEVAAVGGVALKDFQAKVLERLREWLDELDRQRALVTPEMLRATENLEDAQRGLRDYPGRAWKALRAAGRLPAAFAAQPHSSRWAGDGEPVPNVCLKVPTGGGKTLLAAAAVAQAMAVWQRRAHGLVLWIVPNEAIYRQTVKALSSRDHPYRQILNVAAAGRVKVLEKTSPLARSDVESNLCVMVLMLQSAARASKETLRLFRDRGNVLGFLPREDDIEAHWELLLRVPNLDVYPVVGTSAQAAHRQKGAIAKSSLGNALRLVRPLVVIDEGHHAYTENALQTIDGFNPSLMLELSATPRIASAKSSGSNILVDVRGTDLDAAGMIKLPIQVEVRAWSQWQACLGAALDRLDALQRHAERLHGATARYIRPILLVQVERTGQDQRESGFIHAEDVREALLRLGLKEREIAVKTSERDDLRQPENIDLLSPACPVRVIVTKQALQEGWDCPFAYVLCALAAGRNLSAMTQLVGRILRQPQVAKTGDAALDACWVFCHDARTGEVVDSIRKALQGEGMGDLTLQVNGGEAPGGAGAEREIAIRRRQPWRGMRLFLPRVCWRHDDGTRRELEYESDVLAAVRWAEFDASALLDDWQPSPSGRLGASGRMSLGLELLAGVVPQATMVEDAAVLDRARLVRAVADLAPNPWWAWAWWQSVERRLRERGFSEGGLAGSVSTLTEAWRLAVQTERDRLAEVAFGELLAADRIEFRLRADSTDFELPEQWVQRVAGDPAVLSRPQDGQLVQRTLFEPALKTPDLNELELQVAGYLDQEAALRWWHRNVARTQYGLQGWRRHRVYPDFVFALAHDGAAQRLVLLETKGLHLANDDTEYKRALLDRLQQAYSDERFSQVGTLELEGGSRQALSCALVFDANWQSSLQQLLQGAQA